MSKLRREDRYLETEILSSSPEELIIKIFDGLVQFTRIAIEKMKSGDGNIQDIHNNLRKAQRACALLMGGLNFEAAGELSRNLFSIYEFWHHELVTANMRQDYTRIEKILPDMIEYRKTWSKIVEQNRVAKAQAAPADDTFSRVG